MLGSVIRLTATLAIGAMLTGCGLAETGAVATTGGAAEVQQARQAKQIEAQARQRADAAIQQDADHRRAAEAESQ